MRGKISLEQLLQNFSKKWSVETLFDMRLFLHSASSTIKVSLCLGRIKTLMHSPFRTSASLPQMYGRKSVPTQNLYFFQQELADSLFEPRPVSNPGFQNHDTRATLPITPISELPKPNHHDGNLVEHRKKGANITRFTGAAPQYRFLSSHSVH